MNTEFVCPTCKGNLLVRKSLGSFTDCQNSNQSTLCEKCGTEVPFVNGILRFVGKENYSQSFGFQWNIHTRTQLDSHTGLSISKDRLLEALGQNDSFEGKKILEAGSGAGRFTEVLAKTGARIYSFDYSSAVEANQKNNGHARNLTIFQGDIFNIPFKEESFDYVICLGVIQHTPTPEKAFKSLSSKVKPGGMLVIDVYTKSIVSMLQWKYLLRPLTKRMNSRILYGIISKVVPFFLPLTILLKRITGRIGGRFMPIVEYSNLGLPYKLNKEWAVLDTFDMYSPQHDHPQSKKSVLRWFKEIGFENIEVWNGKNGVVGRGCRPL